VAGPAGTVEAVTGVVEEVRRKRPDHFERHPLRLALCPELCAALGTALGVPIEPLSTGIEPSAVDRYAGAMIGRAEPECRGASVASVAAVASAYVAAERASRARARRISRVQERRTVHVGGAVVPYFAGGTGSPLVVLNAIGQGLEAWYPLLERLMSRRRVIVWELCAETGDGRPATVDTHVDVMAAIMDRERAGRCDLLGWCAGAKIATTFSVRRPAAVRSIVLLNGSFKHPGRPAALDSPYERDLESVCAALDRQPARAPQLRRLLSTAAPSATGAADGRPVLALVDPDLRAAVARPFADDQRLVSYARQHLDYWSRDVLPDGRAVSAPITFAAGQFDNVVAPAGVREAAAHFPTGRFVEMPGAGHHVMYDRPDVVAALLDEVLTAAHSVPAVRNT
jgi:pimeloyl-ACP methyl ester carboxylesterase